jgi:hypothetical protein
VSTTAVVTIAYVREHLRMRLVLVLMVVLPALFILVAAGVLSQFATALGGTLAGSAAAALAAGWAAALIAGTLGFFQAVSSREADRRLALAGLGAARVAVSRLLAACIMAGLVSAVALATLALSRGIAHPLHAALAILAFATVYVAIGTLIGTVVHGLLEGSLVVALVFIEDVFNGPGMSPGGGVVTFLTPSRKAGELMMAAGAGQGSSAGDWIGAAATTAIALLVAFAVFWISARRQT